MASVGSLSAPAVGAPTTNRLCDRLAVTVLAAVAAIALMTFRDYGLGWDDYTHAEYGDLLLAFYGSGFADRRALSFVNLYAYGGGFDMLAALAPFAAAMAIVLLGLVRVFEIYPRLTPATGALTGAGFGLSIGSRIMGGFAVVDFAAALAMLGLIEVRTKGLRAAAMRLAGFFLRLLPVVVLAYAVMALVWPWSVIDPLNPFRAVVYFSHFFEKPWSELFAGQLIPVTEMPRSYVPMLLALQLPEIFLGLALAGGVGAAAAICRTGLPAPRRVILLTVVLAATLPILATVLAKPAMYNGIRHFVFVLPPLAVLGGLGAAWLMAPLRRHAYWLAAAIMGVGIALPVVEMVRLHPYEYTYFNRLAGGVAGARGSYMVDYWGLSFKQASHALASWLTERAERKPADRRWKLAVCGPHRSPATQMG